MSEFTKEFIATFIKEDRYKIFINGLKVTLTVAIFALIIGIIIGVLVAILKVYNYQTGKLKILTGISNLYLLIFRGTPIVVQLMILYYLVFINIQNGIYVAIIGFGINSGAYVSEIVRAGILAVDKGQTEAGRSLGLSAGQTMFHIILPQAFKNALPSLFNEFITLFKETSVAGYIAIIDLTKAADLVRARTYSAFFPLFSIALIYLIIVIILTSIQNNIERGMRKSDKR